MNRSIVFRVILSLVLIAIVAGLGYVAYNAGLAQGLAQSAPAAGDAAKGPYAYGYGMPFMHPYGLHAFGFLGCLVPLLLIFLFFGAMRALIWHGPHHGWRHHGFYGGPEGGRWGEGVPPMFAEWHRRAHGEGPQAAEDKKQE